MHVVNLREIDEREITMIQQNDNYDSVIQRANEIPELNCCKQLLGSVSVGELVESLVQMGSNQTEIQEMVDAADIDGEHRPVLDSTFLSLKSPKV